MSNTYYLHIISGGPGSGKTSLLGALAGHGYAVMPEAGRAIIRDQLAIGGTALPWEDPLAFAELMLSWDMRSYHEASAINRPVIFDRGIPDVIGFLKVCGLEVPAHMLEAARRFAYYKRVFIARPWQEIFHEDSERRQSWEEAEATCKAMISIYRSLGYKISMLPNASVEERAEFVMSHIEG